MVSRCCTGRFRSRVSTRARIAAMSRAGSPAERTMIAMRSSGFLREGLIELRHGL